MTSQRTRRAPRRTLEVRTVAIDELHEDPGNARTHDGKNLAAIRESLLRFGQVEPLVVIRGGRVIGGNGRLRVMRQLGWRTVQVVQFRGTRRDATALAVALNRSAELADWDADQLQRTLAELGEHELLGFEAEDLAELLGDPEQKPQRVRESSHQVIALCRDAEQQLEVQQLLGDAGVACRVVTLGDDR